MLLGADTALNPFSIRTSYQALLKLPVEERMKRMQDPAFRAQVLNEKPAPELVHRLSQFRQHIKVHDGLLATRAELRDGNLLVRREALEQLLTIVQARDPEYSDDARQAMVDMFEVMDDPETVAEYRRRLANSLF